LNIWKSKIFSQIKRAPPAPSLSILHFIGSTLK